jgi:hypothetical protein
VRLASTDVQAGSVTTSAAPDGFTDVNTNLSNGLLAVNIDFNSPFGLAGVLVDAGGNVIEFSASGARMNVTQILGLDRSLSAG